MDKSIVIIDIVAGGGDTIHMNSIQVPKQFKSIMRNNASKEYKIASIRDYILKHEGKPLIIKDFDEACGFTNSNRFIIPLIKQGRITRERIGRKRYTYRWHERPLSSGIIRATNLELPPYPIDPKAEESIRRLFYDWVDEHVMDDRLNLDIIRGATMFRQYIKQRLADVEAERSARLAAHEQAQ